MARCLILPGLHDSREPEWRLCELRPADLGGQPVGQRSRRFLHQAVTLGAKSLAVYPDGSLAKGLERHPVISGNVWLTESVAGSVIHQASAKRERASAGLLPTGHVAGDVS